ncbi:MAG: sigma 54-interacting transcriptional regulator [Bryobacteraceae bacterium]|nr:sigma 54-interacting transcriptional regulator [Bryobacteraceae bacterium]
MIPEAIRFRTDPQSWSIAELEPDEDPLARLELERDRSEAIRLLLILFDPRCKPETFALAAEALEETIGRPEVQDWVANGLLAQPLPQSVNLPFIEAYCRHRSWPGLGGFLRRIGIAQPSIRLGAEELNRLMQGAKANPVMQDGIQSALIRSGAWRELAETPIDEVPKALAKLVEQHDCTAGCGFEGPGVTEKYEAEFLGVRAVWASAVSMALIEGVKQLAPSRGAVLIEGETGSGKQIIARALHHYSMRPNAPWVDFNCAAVPEHLVESALFGYEKGAFPGAETSKAGLAELADGGTLFLEEIGELDSRVQVKLLRLLDGLGFYRLGGVRKIAVNVRIVAATNRNLEREVAEGRFREDLYRRLSQDVLPVPPLRERPDDIVPIARLFLEQQNPNLKLSAEAEQLLRGHRWPGNVRELHNVIIRAALSAGPLLQAHDLQSVLPIHHHTILPALNQVRRRAVPEDFTLRPLPKTS